MILRNLKDIEERYEIVAIVLDRFRDRFTYSLECSEMNHGINLLLVKELIYSRICMVWNSSLSLRTSHSAKRL